MSRETPHYVYLKMHILPEPVEYEILSEKYVNLAECRLESEGFQKAKKMFLKYFHFNSESRNVFRISKLENAVSAEAYTIRAEAGKAEIQASSDRAAIYALQSLKQIRQGNFIPEVRISDSPAVALRGFHTNTHSVRQYEAKDILDMIRQMSKFKLNMLLIEYNARFPFAEHPNLQTANGFTPEEIRSFEYLADENDLDIIPLVQCLGHNAHIFCHPEYEKFFEPCDNTSRRNAQFCPLNPEAFELFKVIASEIMEAHPRGKYLHIGGDEARQLGQCPACADFASKHGKGRLYVEYVNKVAEWVISQGRTPIIWDDMLSKHPEAISLIRKDIVIMYWDYWTTCDPSPITVLRPFGRGIVTDISREKENFAGLNEPEKLIARTFAKSVDLDSIRKERPDLEWFMKYLGTDYPRSFTAFPFLDLFRDAGFKVICVPTTLGNTVDELYGLPNFMRFRKNIRAFSEKCKQTGALGLVTSSWYDFPPEILEMGIISTANDLWK